MEQMWGAASPLTSEEQFLLIRKKSMELGLDVVEAVGGGRAPHQYSHSAESLLGCNASGK